MLDQEEMEMNLKEFVTQTLTQIIDGVEEAKRQKGDTRVNPKPRDDTSIEKLHEAGYTISQDTELIQHVEFDVALTVTEGTETFLQARPPGYGERTDGFGCVSAESQHQVLRALSFCTSGQVR